VWEPRTGVGRERVAKVKKSYQIIRLVQERGGVDREDSSPRGRGVVACVFRGVVWVVVRMVEGGGGGEGGMGGVIGAGLFGEGEDEGVVGWVVGDGW
jgi:hypothetical protein